MLQKNNTFCTHDNPQKKKKNHYFKFTTMARYPIEKRKQLLTFSNHTCPPTLPSNTPLPFWGFISLFLLDTIPSTAFFFSDEHYCRPVWPKDLNFFFIWAWILRYLFDLAGGFGILYKKMKRASVNLQEPNGVDEEVNQAKLKHQTLLREYLELQKDFVSKKRKFQTAKQKRDNLVSIIKFLRRKRRFFLNCQPMATELESDLVDLRTVDTKRAMLQEERKHAVSATEVRYEEGGKGRDLGEKVVREVPRTQKIPRKYITDDKGLGKKKTSWCDQLNLKV